jgi:hypothetical protein
MIATLSAGERNATFFDLRWYDVAISVCLSARYQIFHVDFGGTLSIEMEWQEVFALTISEI